MERPVKERLVGAAVLVAAAIILIPEMLSGPKHKDPAEQPASAGPLKTYTIDLNRSPGAPAVAELQERAPPPEIAAASRPPSQQAAPTAGAPPLETRGEGTQAFPESAEPAEAPTVQPSAPPPRPQAQPEPVREHVPAPAASPVVSTPSVPTTRGWAVQLGSFANKATADRLVKDVSGSGQSAFVMPVKSGTATLYRVRIGPFADRAAANDALRGIKGRVANAAVVAHP